MNALPEEDPNAITPDDSDPSNVILRAGYLRGIAAKLTGDDRVFLIRASRSLRAFHEKLNADDYRKALNDASDLISEIGTGCSADQFQDAALEAIVKLNGRPT